MTAYYLTLPKGTITKSHGEIYQGSDTNAVWSPFNPLTVGGWKEGDTVEIMCTFNLEPGRTPEEKWPRVRRCGGLLIGACKASDKSVVQALISRAKSRRLDNPGEILNDHITTDGRDSCDYLFNHAQSTSLPDTPLSPESRGTLNHLIYVWKLTYNAKQTVAEPTDIELFLGYGNPVDSEVVSES